MQPARLLTAHEGEEAIKPGTSGADVYAAAAAVLRNYGYHVGRPDPCEAMAARAAWLVGALPQRDAGT